MTNQIDRRDLDRAMKFEGVAPDANAQAAITHFLGVLTLKYQWVIRLKFARDFKVDRKAHPYKSDGLMMAALLNLCEQIVAAYPASFGGMNAVEVFRAIHQEKLEALSRKASEGGIEPSSMEISKSRERFRKFDEIVDTAPEIELEAELPEEIYPRLIYLALIHVRNQRAAAIEATKGKSARNEFELSYWFNPSRKAVANTLKAGKIPPFKNAWQAALKEVESNPKRQLMRSRDTPDAIELGRPASGRGRGFLPMAKVAKNNPTPETLTP